MSGSIIDMLKKNEVLYCVAKVIKNRRNKQFLDSICGNGKSFDYHVYLNSNTDDKRIYYIISFDWQTNGFFAIIRKITEGCMIADIMNFTPYILVENSIYNVPGGFNGKTNVFDYYFDNNYSDISVHEITDGKNYVFSDPKHLDSLQVLFANSDMGLPEYEISEQYIKTMAQTVRAHLRIKEELRVDLEAQVNNLFNSQPTLGIHYRGGGWQRGLYGHPIPVTFEQYANVIDNVLLSGVEKIFVATDDQIALKKFIERYGNRVVYYDDVIRSSDKTEVQFSKNDREFDEYYLGKEVLRDMFTLSCCDSLVAGLSQVSLFSRIFKESTGNEYREIHIINNGINNQNTKESKKYRGEVRKLANDKIRSAKMR